MLDSLQKRFQFKFKDRTYAANILAAALEDFLGKEKERKDHDNFLITVLGIPRGGKRLFRQSDKFNDDSFYNLLKQVHHKFPKCYLFLDKAPQHYISKSIDKI